MNEIKRCYELFNYAKLIYPNDKFLANKYVQMAISALKKKAINIPNDLKIFYCKGCFSYLGGSETKSTRTHNNKLIITCKKCKKIKRYILKI